MKRLVSVLLLAGLLAGCSAIAQPQAPPVTAQTLPQATSAPATTQAATTQAPTTAAPTTQAATTVPPTTLSPEEARVAGWISDIQLLEKKLKTHPVFEAPFHTSILEAEARERAKALQADLKAAIVDSCAALVERVPESTDDAIRLELLRITALFSAFEGHGDGHTYLIVPYWEDSYYFPLGFQTFETDIYLTSVFTRQDYAEQDALLALRGSKLLSINGHSVSEIEAVYARYQNADNPVMNRESLADGLGNKYYLDLLGITGKAPTAFVFEDSRGRKRTVAVYQTVSYSYGMEEARQPGERPLFQQFQEETATVRRLEEASAYYVRMTSMSGVGAEISLGQFGLHIRHMLKSCAEAGNTDKIIFDLRDNPGGDMGFSRSFEELMYRYAALEDSGRIYVLVNQRSFSAAVHTAYRLKKVHNATIVGEPTGGGIDCYSRTMAMTATLPYSGLHLQVSVQAHTAGAMRVGYNGVFDTGSLQPDVYVPYTVKDYLENHDPALAWILDQE